MAVEPFHDEGREVQEVVEHDRRVGEDDALDRGVTDVALVPQGDILQRRERVGPDEAREPADTLGQLRVAFVRHGARALLALPEGLLRLEDLRALEPAHLEGDLLERGGGYAEHRAELGVPGGPSETGGAGGPGPALPR